jgi:hypothetical protein
MEYWQSNMFGRWADTEQSSHVQKEVITMKKYEEHKQMN